MTLTPGTRLGPYEIVAPLGAGGMGEVYRAKDTKLNRDVAIKVLPESFALDADRVARFTREAQVLASLNHPNIAQIYGIKDNAIVMELVEGKDLSTIIVGGPEGPPLRQSEEASNGSRSRGPSGPRADRPRTGLPLDEALPIAKQIADALEAAHEQGIVHRDLKPQNIKVRADGTVKVLDFGLAKAIDPSSASSSNLANSPTMTSPAMTGMGMILGTAAYMSPEQAKGRAVDKRTDIWAFGVVLYEMLSGRRAFESEDVSDLLVAVLSKDVDLAALPAGTPPAIVALMRRCLVRDPKDRLRDIGEARLALSDAHVISDAVVLAAAPVAPLWRRLLPWSVAALAVIVASLSIGRGAAKTDAPVVWTTIEVPSGYALGEEDDVFFYPARRPFALLPEDRGVVLVARPLPDPAKPAATRTAQLFFRPLDRKELRPIAGTEDADAPFVSPDGRWIGFFAKAELRKVSIDGGAPIKICSLPGTRLGPFGASWGPGDTIVFGDLTSGRIMRVPASGGEPTPVTAAPSGAGRRRHVSPVFLPDGKRILYVDASAQRAADTKIMLQPLDGGAPTLVIDRAATPRVLADGVLVFNRLSTLMTVPFDVGRGVTTGTPTPALADVMQSALMRRHGVMHPTVGLFDVSSGGTLVAVRGGLAAVPGNDIVWVDEHGEHPASPAQGHPAGFTTNSRVSPDGRRVLVTMMASAGLDVWLIDWSRNVWLPCQGCDADLGIVVWAPDSRRVLFGRDGALVEHALDGAGPDKTLVEERDRSLLPVKWLADGRIVFLSSPNLVDYEVKLLTPGSTATQSVLGLGASQQPDVSNDGKWITFSDKPREDKDREVFIQPLTGGQRMQASSGGGAASLWAPDGRALYFGLAGGDPRTYRVDIDRAGDTAVIGAIREVPMRSIGFQCAPLACGEMAAGPRYLGHSEHTSVALEPVVKIDLVLNWIASLGKNR